MGHDPQTYRFFLMTIDPVHVGTGGMLLGRVDNPIVREPGTRLPKIPGTALHGAVRHYAAARYGKISCAGQKGHCGRPPCPICYTFGSIEGEMGSFSGVVSISDARILLFPVYSMVGPVWVTSPTALYDAGLGEHEVSPDKAKWGGNGSDLLGDKPLNLGWLMVEREGNLPDISWPSQIPPQIRNRIVLVSDKLFSRIVNSNLEVRTSVSINPETGAAEEGALFTYEAIPRATVLWMDVVVDDFRGGFPSKKNLEKWGNTLKEKNDSAKQLLKSWHLWKEDKKEKFDDSLQKALNWIEDDLGKYRNSISWEDAAQVVTSGLEWAEHLGIGGMGTRGFGRIKTLCCTNLNKNGNPVEECTQSRKSPSETKEESGGKS
ncbi:MAG TPA: type III-B CRISPR module RAMP protein Cmr4 [Phaeodactylibacter sp.]|nr:type III-B CRISPR module RAMP protein Cmr4 [Phaeodactylibacter sp.]